ncbi:DNA-protecting protein DprA [Ectothiorhodospira shaposhnikovii]|uniref:DNA-processing protein DprA n=1 Tax=Ectothiorhodospira shaposhnikovii TaxID=1054 RepID=UPI001908E6DD|nr:DNA-processing protein DprA [Ectothiorhodospira shaposhnikovii]MBK1671724.1 DNA-protecting protein DprA [Ectothiorhodospira shaposhnikovii]
MEPSALAPWLHLWHAPGVGPVTFTRLLQAHATPQGVLAAGRTAWQQAGLSPEAMAFLEQDTPPGIQADLDWVCRDGHHILTLEDPRYPPRLKNTPAPPPVLYVVGDPQVLSWPMLAVVGSRHPTPGGRETAAAFSAHLARRGLVIASGLAKGIDAAAHEGTLAAQGLTVAVTGTGPDRIYPAAHRALAHRIVAEGAMVTELPTGTPVTPQNFPRRNRILAGLAVGTLVVEAATRSGSLITARLAAEQGREVFAIPGSIHNPLARGCHRLIREGAKLVETADDILEELGDLLPPHARQSRLMEPPAAPDQDMPDEDHVRLLEAMGYDPVSVDQLVARTTLTVGAVSSMLLLMELRGQVASLSGGRYVRLRSESGK